MMFNLHNILPRDKQLHLWAGWTVTATALALGAPLVYAVGAAVVAGALKEIHDLAGFGSPDWWDWAATAAGGALWVPLCVVAGCA